MVLSLLEEHAWDAPVAFGPKGVRSARQLLLDAARVASALPPPAPDEQLLLVFREDNYAFAAALWACLARGHRVALPADTGRESVLDLAQRPETRLVLHDTPSGAPLHIPRLLDAAPPSEPWRASDAPARDARLSLYARGADGTQQPVARCLGALCEEATVLTAALGISRVGAVVSGLAPSHPFALVCGVLGPLLRGGAMARYVASTTDLLPSTLGEHGRATWLATPHQISTADPTAARRHLSRIVSGGAPSHGESLARWQHELGMPVGEALGTHGEGSLLFRASADSEDLRPLPGVAAEVEAGFLKVQHCPWAAASHKLPRLTNLRVDRGSDAGVFRCLGHAHDWRILGGRPLSLPLLTQRVNAMPATKDAALCVPESGPCAGQLLAAVVPEPGAPLFEDVATGLRAILPAGVELSRVMQVDQIPRDTLGGVEEASLLRRFGLKPSGHPLRLALDWEAEEDPPSTAAGACEAPHGATYRVRIPEDYAYFDGHFPGYPILPGAVQLGELVMPCVRRARPDLGKLSQLSRVKFLGRIVPGASVDVRLSWNEAESWVDFCLDTLNTRCAAGRLTFHSEKTP